MAAPAAASPKVANPTAALASAVRFAGFVSQPCNVPKNTPIECESSGCCEAKLRQELPSEAAVSMARAAGETATTEAGETALEAPMAPSVAGTPEQRILRVVHAGVAEKVFRAL